MVLGTKTISVLMVALLATWLPLAPCCLAMACETLPAAATPDPADDGCDVCHTTEAPIPAPEDNSTSNAPADEDCPCPDQVTAAPDPDPMALTSMAGATHLLPALDLSVPLGYHLDVVVGQPRPHDHDVGPPLFHGRSLLAQACLLTV